MSNLYDIVIPVGPSDSDKINDQLKKWIEQEMNNEKIKRPFISIDGKYLIYIFIQKICKNLYKSPIFYTTNILKSPAKQHSKFKFSTSITLLFFIVFLTYSANSHSGLFI